MKETRCQSIASRYKSFKPEITTFGSQIEYEVEQDLIAMKQTIQRLQEYIEEYENRDDRLPYFHSIEIGYRDLLKRVSKYSCPSNLKERYKTKVNCPLKENSKCVK